MLRRDVEAVQISQSKHERDVCYRLADEQSVCGVEKPVHEEMGKTGIIYPRWFQREQDSPVPMLSRAVRVTGRPSVSVRFKGKKQLYGFKLKGLFYNLGLICMALAIICIR